jgi:hypothetical protein
VSGAQARLEAICADACCAATVEMWEPVRPKTVCRWAIAGPPGEANVARRMTLWTTHVGPCHNGSPTRMAQSAAHHEALGPGEVEQLQIGIVCEVSREFAAKTVSCALKRSGADGCTCSQKQERQKKTSDSRSHNRSYAGCSSPRNPDQRISSSETHCLYDDCG